MEATEDGENSGDEEEPLAEVEVEVEVEVEMPVAADAEVADLEVVTIVDAEDSIEDAEDSIEEVVEEALLLEVEVDFRPDRLSSREFHLLALDRQSANLC